MSNKTVIRIYGVFGFRDVEGTQVGNLFVHVTWRASSDVSVPAFTVTEPYAGLAAAYFDSLDDAIRAAREMSDAIGWRALICALAERDVDKARGIREQVRAIAEKFGGHLANGGTDRKQQAKSLQEVRCAAREMGRPT